MPQSGRHPHRPLPLVAFTDFAGYCEQKDPSHSRISQDRPKPLLRIRGGCGGDENRPDFSGRPSRCHLRRSDKLRPWKLSAGVRPDDSPRAAGAASEARPERRRHVVKRRAAVAAYILWRALHAQPVTPRGALRIQTLYRPTGKILHLLASQNVQEKRPVKLAELCAGASSVSREIYTISRGTFPRGQESRV